jgi:hypothetical protein
MTSSAMVVFKSKASRDERQYQNVITIIITIRIIVTITTITTATTLTTTTTKNKQQITKIL